MTPDQLITRAIHCLNTGQPNMTRLYLRKASLLVAAHRQQLKDELRELKYRQLELDGRPLEAALVRIGDQANDWAEAMAKALATNMPTQSGFALAGPAARP